MPQVALPWTGGMVTNVAEVALREHSPLVVNLMLDSQGNNLSRPGMAAFATLTPSYINSDTTYDNYPGVIGLCAYKNWLIAVTANRRVFALSEDGTVSDLCGSAMGTNILPGATDPTFTEDIDGTLIICGGAQMMKWTGTGLLTPFSSAFSPKATHCVVCQGYLLANDAGNDDIYYSDLNDHSLWDPGSWVFQAESRQDPCTAIACVQNQVYLFGTESIDVYYPTRVADPAFVRSHTINRGLASPSSLVSLDGALYWLDERRRLVRLVDREPVVISAEIEASLTTLSTVSDCTAFRLDIGGRHLLGWNFPTDKTCFVTDYVLSSAQHNVWYQWRGWSGGKWAALDIRSCAYHPRWNHHFCGTFDGGYVRYLSTSYGTDAGATLRRVRRTPFVNWNTLKLKRDTYLRLLAERGTTASPSSSEPEVEVRLRDENLIWYDAYRLGLSARGDLDLIGEGAGGLGQYRVRQWEFATEANVPDLKLLAPVIDYDVMLR